LHQLSNVSESEKESKVPVDVGIEKKKANHENKRDDNQKRRNMMEWDVKRTQKKNVLTYD
jgi:hypothetical protein